jgi:NDP-sugar pyrophosphorylase family protein
MPSSRTQLVIPMAGAGTRFVEAGYTTPKPLLPIHGVPMYEVVVLNVLPPGAQRVVIVARSEWHLEESVSKLGERLGLDLHLVEVSETTGGPADTVEFAVPLLDPGAPVVVANSDQYVDANLTEFHDLVEAPEVDGVILAMEDDDPKWSYVSLDSDGKAEVVREKKVISPYATVGIYGFCNVWTMLDGFSQMRRKNDRTNGEFYVAPSYNYLIERGARVQVSNLGPIGTVMHGMGIPEDYESFIRSPVSERASRAAQWLP